MLVDFLWFRRARTVKRVRLGGHARTVSDAGRRGRLLETVFAPIFARYGQEPVVWGWDLCNEPEWAVRRMTAPPASTVRRATAAFLREAAACAHEYASQPVTVGLASLRGLGLVRSAHLDVYQVHWYDSLQRRAPLETTIDSLGLDRPVLLGEFRRAGRDGHRRTSSRPRVGPAMPGPWRGRCWRRTGLPTSESAADESGWAVEREIARAAAATVASRQYWS